MTVLSDRLDALLREYAMTPADHQALDGRGQGTFDHGDHAPWSWQVTVTAATVHVTAQLGPVTPDRTEAAARADALFDRLAELLPHLSFCSVGARTVYDRVNGSVVGWLGAVSVHARLS